MIDRHAPVMALDIASTTGFAIGEVGSKLQPISGSVRFAPQGASHEAIFAGALKWASATIKLHAPRTIVWEAPLATSFKRGKTTANVTTVLYGIPAVIGAVAHLLGVYDVRKAETRDVRLHFIGKSPKRDEAKRLTMRQCRAHGWDIGDDNEADALAIWSYMCALIDPQLATTPTPLFLQGRK
jgi:hypothetical protein